MADDEVDVVVRRKPTGDGPAVDGQWLVVLLLAFSLMLAPLAAWLPAARMARVRDALATAVERRGVVLLAALPLALVAAVLGMEESFVGWSRWAYLLFFAYGFLLASDDRFRTVVYDIGVRRTRVTRLLFGIRD